jgi:drug/metabolite transporter (DMT)-like permease
LLGVILAALSAATFAFNSAALRRGVLTGSVAQALAITVPIGVPIFLLAGLLSGASTAIAQFSPQAIAVLAFVGVLHFVGGRYCNYRAAQAIGANLSAPVIQLSLVVTLALAVLVLNESFTVLRVLGIAMVVVGPLLTKDAEPPARSAANNAASLDGAKPVESGMPPAFHPLYAQGYFFALLSAAVYGVTPIMIRPLVANTGASGGLVAGLISYTAASLAIGLLLFWPGQFRHVTAVNRESVKWFTFSGVFVCISQMFLYMAFALAPVSVVIALVQLQLLFRYWFAQLLNPHHEIFGGKMILATVISLLGTLALSIDHEWLLSMIPLPDAMAAVMRWHWP